MAKKQKQYTVLLAKRFPQSHPRKGQETDFLDSVYKRIKIHTLRLNYPLWEKRFEKIAKGEAVLVLKQWSGVPYRSKQETVKVLEELDGIGLDKVEVKGEGLYFCNGIQINPDRLALNDGLTYEDFKAWFSGVTGDVACIHFTAHRYNERLK